MDRVNEDFAFKILMMKSKVEDMLSRKLNHRAMKKLAYNGAGGFSLFSDNVGKIINPRLVKDLACQLIKPNCLDFFPPGLTLASLTKVIIYRWP